MQNKTISISAETYKKLAHYKNNIYERATFDDAIRRLLIGRKIRKSTMPPALTARNP